MNQYCDTFITVEKEALIQNAKYFKEKSGKKLIAVIKANAYGHGLVAVGHILKDEADIFAVASLDSAITLRENGIDLPILVLNPLNNDNVPQAIENDIMITISRYEDVVYLEEHLNKKVKVHINIDSGMNRMGLKTKEEYQKILTFIDKSEHIEAVGVYTHYHSAEEESYSKSQQREFYEIYQSMPYDFEYVHLCNTTGTINGWDIPESTHVRVGLGLYGICEGGNVKPALSLYSRIKIKKTVHPGETVGYSATYQTDQVTEIGVLPLGYSDGIIRKNKGRKVYVDGHYCEIVGNVCMNSLMIKLPQQDVAPLVELIGSHVTVFDIAEHTDTITYEVTTILPPHIKRFYI